ncbi:MAG TPA: AMP-binding protein [Saprospiraceae bacterium]|nr:AMP-binding protein [Saprospiraceae bacterium]
MNSFQFLFDLPAYQSSRNSKLIVSGHWKKGQITSIAAVEFLQKQHSISLHLLELGIRKGDRVILITEQYSWTWLVIDLAIMATGAITVPLYFPQKKEDLQFILDRIEPALVIR